LGAGVPVTPPARGSEPSNTGSAKTASVLGAGLRPAAWVRRADRACTSRYTPGGYQQEPTAKPKANSGRSTKSRVPGSKDGTYVGGKGSSHKGGHYKNPATGNKERNRKAGVPK
jgi:hypothetical protein